MSQKLSVSVTKVDKNYWQVRGCTYPHRTLLLELGCEWQAKQLAWRWQGEKLPTALEQLKNGTYGLEGLETPLLAIPKISIVPPSNPSTPTPESRKFKIGDRVKTTLGRTGGIVTEYNGQWVSVRFKDYDPIDFDDDDLALDDVTVYRDQLKVGMEVIWNYHNPKGVDLSYKATVEKINPKTVCIIAQEAKGRVQHNVKVESLNHPQLVKA